MQLLLNLPGDAKNVTLSRDADESGGLTEVTIYPTCAISLQRVVVLAFLVLGQIDTGWQDTQLTCKQLKHTNSRCPE